MKYVRTILQLYAEARTYSPSTNVKHWKIFRNLGFLYLKSKFSRSKKPIISYPIDQFRVYAYDYPTLIQLYRDIFLKQVYRFNAQSDTPFIIDCGANIGLSLLFFKKCYPQSELWAFEANPNSFELLTLNIKKNNIQNIKTFPVAVSNVNGTVDFYVPHKKGSLNGSLVAGYNDGIKVAVQAKKLSEMVAHRKIDFIKLDIEGAEETVIRDLAENHILDSVDELVVEHHTNPAIKNSLSDFMLYFDRSKFDCQFRSSEDSGTNQDTLLYFKRRKP